MADETRIVRVCFCGHTKGTHDWSDLRLRRPCMAEGCACRVWFWCRQADRVEA